jgi:hypothetical protein
LRAPLRPLEGFAAEGSSTFPFCLRLQVKRITPRHLQLAIRGDEELDTLIKVGEVARV